MLVEYLHFGAAGLSLCLSALGCGLGIGIAGQGVSAGALRQPMAVGPVFNAMVIGVVIIESGAIITLVATLMALFGLPIDCTFPQILAASSGLLAVGFVSMLASFVSGFIVYATAQAIARVPIFSSQMTTFMLLSQSLLEAPIIFALIVNLAIRANLQPALSLDHAITLVAAACCVAIGSVGPAIGQSVFAYTAVHSIGKNYRAYSKFFTFALMNYAFIESAVVFCLIISLYATFILPGTGITTLKAIKTCVAAGTISLGALGGTLALGFVGKKSCENLAQDDIKYPSITRISLVTGVFIESTIIYAFLIALLLII
jgi:F-type H+-transporting ATPase subunit c